MLRLICCEDCLDGDQRRFRTCLEVILNNFFDSLNAFETLIEIRIYSFVVFYVLYTFVVVQINDSGLVTSWLTLAFWEAL